ncbi:MAG: hypothetical protein M3066_01645, partial [Actinomycetota bacterium]|nr:hypothetical protein [Actinomycetota bacterium]
ACGAGGAGGAGGIASGTLARTGAVMQPYALMALALTVLGMLMFFGSQGLPDPTSRLRFAPAALRPLLTGQPRAVRVAPVAASSRLDATALDAFVEMSGPRSGAKESGPSAGRRIANLSPRRWLSQRPW